MSSPQQPVEPETKKTFSQEEVDKLIDDGCDACDAMSQVARLEEEIEDLKKEYAGESWSNSEWATNWVSQFRHVSAKQQCLMSAKIRSLLDKLETEVRMVLPSTIMLAPVNTYWFERENYRIPKDDEVRVWEFHVKFEDLTEEIYKEEREYTGALNNARRFAAVFKKPVKSIEARTYA